jgi:hypothetical protein
VTVVSPCRSKTVIHADAIILSCGAREKTMAERGWIYGARCAQQFFTMQILDLLDGCQAIPLERAAIFGSDLIAYSAAAKLRAAGASEVTMVDTRDGPAADLLGRLYFRQWTRPESHFRTKAVTIVGERSVLGLEIDGLRRECDGIVLCGELVPNSELLVAAGFKVTQPDRIPIGITHNALSEPGWFVAGAERGGLHGAYWCYRDGMRAAAKACKFLN